MKAFQLAFTVLLFLLSQEFVAIAQEAAEPDFRKAIIPEGWFPAGIQVEAQRGTLPAAAADNGRVPRRILFVSLGLIKRFEGWFPDFYDDPVGYCTIGWGHLIEKRECASVSGVKRNKFSPRPLDVSAGQELLIKDIIPSRRAVDRLVVVRLTDRQFGALTSFVYNVGADNFRKSTLLKMINAGDIEGAKGQFARWNRANGVPLNGLKKRRACELALFNGYGRNLQNGLFDVSFCALLPGVAAEDPANSVDIIAGEVGQ
ncbi:lysozyme [Rhizobium anhuiense bv. trifolii]|nr:lysozyme [Rhizobium anhuiense bv. trifolii]